MNSIGIFFILLLKILGKTYQITQRLTLVLLGPRYSSHLYYYQFWSSLAASGYCPLSGLLGSRPAWEEMLFSKGKQCSCSVCTHYSWTGSQQFVCTVLYICTLYNLTDFLTRWLSLIRQNVFFILSQIRRALQTETRTDRTIKLRCHQTHSLCVLKTICNQTNFNLVWLELGTASGQNSYTCSLMDGLFSWLDVIYPRDFLLADL